MYILYHKDSYLSLSKFILSCIIFLAVFKDGVSFADHFLSVTSLLFVILAYIQWLLINPFRLIPYLCTIIGEIQLSSTADSIIEANG